MEPLNSSSIARYAIWLVPDEDSSERFSDILERLRAEYGGPPFAPHVTLLESIIGKAETVGERMESLARALQPMPVHAVRMVMEPYYFRSFYLKLETTDALSQARDQAAQEFSVKPETAFRPHISLLYGLVPRKTKVAIGPKIHQDLPVEFTLTRLQLVRLALAVSDWKTVVDLPLGEA
jgi:2'-5' RNA ligase